MTYSIFIEDAVLSAFERASFDMVEQKHYFKLDVESFSSDFKRKMAKLINDELEKDDGCIPVALTLLEERLSESQQNEFSKLLAQTPMPLSLAKRYHDEVLVASKIKRAMARKGLL